MNLRELVRVAESQPPENEGVEIARATRAKERREDRAETYAIMAANATSRTVTYQRRYRADGETRTVRQRIAPGNRVNAAELLKLAREAVRLGCYRLERRGMRITDEDRLDAVAELCTRVLAESSVAGADVATLPRREKLGKTYLRDRAAGIILDAWRKRQREELTDEWEGLAAAVGVAEDRADNAADPYLVGAPPTDPAAAYLRDAARGLRLWPHGPEEAALLAAMQPAVPSAQWGDREGISASAWRSRVSTGARAWEAIPDDPRAAIRAAERAANQTEADDIERDAAELERMMGEAPD